MGIRAINAVPDRSRPADLAPDAPTARISFPLPRPGRRICRVQERLPIQGLRTKEGRLGVIYSRNDYSDAWKVPKGSYVPDATKEQAFRMGINW